MCVEHSLQTMMTVAICLQLGMWQAHYHGGKWRKRNGRTFHARDGHFTLEILQAQGDMFSMNNWHGIFNMGWSFWTRPLSCESLWISKKGLQFSARRGTGCYYVLLNWQDSQTLLAELKLEHALKLHLKQTFVIASNPCTFDAGMAWTPWCGVQRPGWGT